MDRRTWLRASAIDELSRVSIWPEARSDETLGGSGLTTRPRPLCQEEKLKSVADFGADVLGRRWAMIIPATIGLFITPLYLFVDLYPLLAGAFIAQGAFLGAIYGQNPSYLSERFPTEVRATASGFCFGLACDHVHG